MLLGVAFGLLVGLFTCVGLSTQTSLLFVILICIEIYIKARLE